MARGYRTTREDTAPSRRHKRSLMIEEIVGRMRRMSREQLIEIGKYVDRLSKETRQ